MEGAGFTQKSQKQGFLFGQDTDLDRGPLLGCKERLQALCSIRELRGQELGDRGLNLGLFFQHIGHRGSSAASTLHHPGLLCSLART